MKYTTYLFDFDGTLVDSMPVFVPLMLKILDENGISYGSDIVKIITPLGYQGIARYFQSLGVAKTEEELILQMHSYAEEAYRELVPAKKHVVSTLQKLKAEGADLYVLTASPHLALDPCLKRLGIYELFTNVWSCDDFFTTKSNPEIYHMAAARIGKPIEEILFLDDNYNADMTAKQAGMKVCGVYDESSKEYEDDIRAVADCYIRDFSELLELENKEIPPIWIGKANASDIDGIEAVYSEIHTLEEAGEAVIGWIRDVYPTRETAQSAFLRGDLFVLREQGRVAGAAIINQIQLEEYKKGVWQYPASKEEVMVLHTLVISPKAGNRGYGKRFVSFYEEYAKNHGCNYLRIDTNAKNLRARKLYKTLGFSEVGIVPCQFNEIPGVNMVLLEKKL